MKMSSFVWSIAMSLFLQASVVAQLSQDKFEQLHQDINPQSEKWKSVPWDISMVEAQQRAAREGRLLFIWAMDGHPLGCT